MSNTDNSAAAVPVQVKSAWLSKLNWISALTAIASAANELTGALQQVAPFVPAKYQHYVTVGIIVTGAIANIIVKTKFTNTITPSSAAKLS